MLASKLKDSLLWPPRSRVCVRPAERLGRSAPPLTGGGSSAALLITLAPGLRQSRSVSLRLTVAAPPEASTAGNSPCTQKGALKNGADQNRAKRRPVLFPIIIFVRYQPANFGFAQRFSEVWNQVFREI